ncbi:MAG: cytidine deaminase [Actinomycetes bacterium]
MTTVDDGLQPDDAKLVTLARGARARVQAPSGAAVRDETGRTYAGADVRLPSLSLSALAVAVAQAVASGARGLEAAVVVADPADAVDPVRDLDAVRELGGSGVVVLVCGVDGSVRDRLQT